MIIAYYITDSGLPEINKISYYLIKFSSIISDTKNVARDRRGFWKGEKNIPNDPSTKELGVAYAALVERICPAFFQITRMR